MARLSGSCNRIRLPDEEIEYELVHRPRVTRRIHLEIDPRGGLRVVAPRSISRQDIQRSLQNRAPQVARFLDRAREQQSELPQLRYVDGESHLYLGQAHSLELLQAPGKRGRVEREDAVLRVLAPDSHPEKVRNQLLRWYRQAAQRQFSQRLHDACARAPWTHGEMPPLRLRAMKRTWGNCTVEGVITLNTALIKAPAELIDYVIGHEVCHLREHNHGPGFYRLQQRLFPRWREAKQQLADRGHLYLHS
jgi:predicted metal-dependent hydrolase